MISNYLFSSLMVTFVEYLAEEAKCIYGGTIPRTSQTVGSEAGNMLILFTFVNGCELRSGKIMLITVNHIGMAGCVSC